MNLHEKRVTAALYSTDRMKDRGRVFAANCQWCGSMRTKKAGGGRSCPNCDEPQKEKANG